MSKRSNRRKANGGSRMPMIALIVGGALLVLAVVILALPKGGSPDGDGGEPALAVDQERIDFGDVKLDTPLTFKIQVTNTGSGTLRFKEAPYIEVLEGC